MDKTLTDLYQTLHQNLQKMIGFHCNLMEVVRAERDALVNVAVKDIQETVSSKQALVESIRQTEAERLRTTTEIAVKLKRPLRELTLSELILVVQGHDLKLADQFRSSLNTLTVLVQRVSDLNKDNQLFVEHSLQHVDAMKKNVMGESVPKSNTYTQQGQRSAPVKGARFISKEA